MDVPPVRPSRTPLWIKAVAAGLVGTGIAGNGYWNYVNQSTNKEQEEQSVALKGEISQSRSTVDELNTRLLKQNSQMGSMQNELTQSRRTIGDLTQSLQQSRAGIQGLNAQLTELNRELGTRITLDQMITAVSTVTPSTVSVEGEMEMVNIFTGEKQKVPTFGSGIILIGSNGERYILTNSHVTEDQELKRKDSADGVYHIKLYNGSDYKKPVEFDAPPVILSNGKRAFSPPDKLDLCLLLIPPDVKLSPDVGIKMRDIKAHPLKVGEPVFAIGNPFAERDSVTFGNISHTDRANLGVNLVHNVQTDAPINPGNSGGGLFTVRVENGVPIAELVAINNWKYMDGDGVTKSIRVDYVQQTVKNWGITLK